MKALKAFIQKGLFTDLLIGGGLGMVFYGIQIHWPWLAFTVVGTALVGLGLMLLPR